MNLRRTRAVARKEFLHILRDSRSLAMALLMPLVMLLLFGYALTLDVDRIPTVIYDSDHSPESRDLVAQFRGSRYFEVAGEAQGYPAIEREIDKSRVLLALVIPRDYSHNLLAGRDAEVQLLVDGSDSNTASIGLSYAGALLQTYALELNQRAGIVAKQAVEPRLRVWYNPDLKSRNYIVPGLIAVILMIIASLLTSLTIAREWEMGTMEQILSTPLRPSELLLGKLSAHFTLGLADMVISLAVGLLLFHVPFRGDPVLLFVSACIFLFGALCWGILLSTVMRSQLLAYQAGMLSSFLPAFLLSGFIYSIENMPQVIQVISYLVPARYFISLLRGIFLKGIGVTVLWPQLAFLLLYAGIVFLIATKKLGRKVA